MDVDKLAIDLLLKGMTKEQQNAALDSIKESVTQAKAIQKQRIGENVQVVVQALKKIEADIKARYDETGKVIEKRVSTIKDGKDGQNGANGREGKDGRPGRDGTVGPRGANGVDGRNGRDGVDGVSVTSAFIDFDGSLVINLSDGQVLNVGEVVAPDLAEKIKVITSGGGTSQVVLDALVNLQNQINNLIPSQAGNAGKFLTTDGTDVSWGLVTGANLTGAITSTGNATLLGSFTSADLAGALTDETGSGSAVFATSPTLVTPALGTPSALVGTNITGTASGLTAGNVTTNANLTGAVTSTGNATLLGSFTSAQLAGALTDETGSGANVFATSPTLVTPALGTPSSATLTNATGLPISTGVSGLGTGVATFLATPSSANLAAAVTDETGTGALVFATSPTLVTPALGTPSALVGTNITGTATAFTASNVTTNANLTGAVTSTGNATLLGSFSSANLAGALTDETGSGSAVFATSPTLVTPALGTPSSGVVTNLTGTASININGTVGATTPATGSFTSLAYSTTLTGGTGVVNLGSGQVFKDASGNVGIGTSTIGSAGVTLTSAYNIGWVQSAGQSIPNIFRQTSSAATVLANGYRHSATANGFASSFSSSWPKTAIALIEGTVRFFTDTAATTAAGTDVTPTERMRIDSAGNLLVGTASPGFVNDNGTAIETGVVVVRHVSGTASGNGYMFFILNGSMIGSITQSGTTAVLYNTTSDYRLKTVIGPVANAGQRIDALQPVEYTWNASGERTCGFLAHQFQEVYAGSVSGTKDAVDAEGKPVYQAMQASTSEVIADLVAELQSLRARITALTARVAALESN